MTSSRRSYPSDVSDDEWALVAPYLTLLREDAGQREHGLASEKWRVLSVKEEVSDGRIQEAVYP